MSQERLDTRAVHSGEPKPGILGSVNLPIFQSSTYLHDPEQLHDGVRYHRLNNSPQHKSLGIKLASLENTESALVCSSGMAAVTTALLALVPHGGHVIAQERLYAGTRSFLDKFWKDLGREVTFFDPYSHTSWNELVRPNTAAIYIESLENPLIRLPDFEKIVKFAKQHKLISMIDNTFPSPINFRPAEWGFDVVIHSATKYLNGHSDVIAGCIAGSKAHVLAVRDYLNIMGGSLDPQSCFLLQRGLKTLGIRVRQHNINAMTLAEALGSMKTVRRVLYPGLSNHPDHALAKRYFNGFGGMLTFDFAGTPPELDARLKKLHYAFNAPSLGGPETLLTLPTQTSFASFSEAQKKALGITDTLVRVSVGLEDAADLIADFKRAFD